MAKHCMIDIETWGTGPTALIISIGAVVYDPEDATANMDMFECGIDPEAFGGMTFGTVTAATLKWWMDEKRDAARKVWLDMKKLDAPSALHGFISWYEANSRTPLTGLADTGEWSGPNSMPTWGNGATFDLVVLRSLCEKLNRECPWKFWDERCYRTLKNLTGAPPLPPMPTGLEAHTALADAIRQAEHHRSIVAWQHGLLDHWQAGVVNGDAFAPDAGE